MKLGTTEIEDTFAEAFGVRYARLLVTAADDYWLDIAVKSLTGYGTSVIACDCEIGLERHVGPDESPDGRPCAAVLAVHFAADRLGKALLNRTGQCLMTCPTTAVFDGLPSGTERLPLGKLLRFFGDGFQKSKLIDARRYWRIPVMDGEFLVEESIGAAKGVAGGNILIQAETQSLALDAARRGVAATAQQHGVITPFPGGVVRSGSKVGSRYKKLVASTSDGFCPTLRGRVESKLHPEAHCVYEIVFDGIDSASVAAAMTAAMHAAAAPGVHRISAGNYGGKLGKFHFRLRELLAGA